MPSSGHFPGDRDGVEDVFAMSEDHVNFFKVTPIRFREQEINAYIAMLVHQKP